MSTYEAALAAIAERRVLIAAGTPGEWEVSPHTHAGRVWVSRKPNRFLRGVILEPIFQARDTADHATREADAAKVVSAVNAYPLLLDLVEAVLLRHYVSPGTEHCDLCWDGPKRGIIQTRESWWPCPDARAALTSLGIEAGE